MTFKDPERAAAYARRNYNQEKIKEKNREYYLKNKKRRQEFDKKFHKIRVSKPVMIKLKEFKERVRRTNDRIFTWSGMLDYFLEAHKEFLESRKECRRLKDENWRLKNET